MSEFNVGPKAKRIFWDVLDLEAMDPVLSKGDGLKSTVMNGEKWRFLSHALNILEERGLLLDPEGK